MPASAPLCKTCSMPAVSVCSLQICKRLFHFKGCDQPFCEEHGVCHKTPSRGPFNELLSVEDEDRAYNIIEKRKKAILSLDGFVAKRLAGEDPCHLRFCDNCLLQWKLKVTKAKVYLCFLALFAILFSAFLTSSQIVVKPEVCGADRILSVALDKCFVKKDLLPDVVHVAYRTGGACSLFESNDGSAFRVFCKCPPYQRYDTRRQVCFSDTCQSLQITGFCLDMSRAKMQKSPDLSRNLTCPLYRKFNQHFGTCIQDFCPKGYDVKEDGTCHRCPVYYTGSSTGCTSTPLKWASPNNFYLPSFGIGRCHRNQDGNYSPFLDGIGNLQCFVPEKPVDRLCRPDEVLRKSVIGCHFSCPPFSAFDYLKKECLTLSCERNEVLLESGQCYRCSVYYSPAEPDFEISKKCKEAQEAVWPEGAFWRK